LSKSFNDANTIALQKEDKLVGARANLVESNKSLSTPTKEEADKASLNLTAFKLAERESNQARALRDGYREAKRAKDNVLNQREAELEAAKAKEAAAKKELEDAVKFAELVKLGVLERAVQVPANAAACVTAMGK